MFVKSARLERISTTYHWCLIRVLQSAITHLLFIVIVRVLFVALTVVSVCYSFPFNKLLFLYVYWTVNHCDIWRIKDQLDVTWYFYFTSDVLNMFRTLIYPSSGACDYSVELPHWSIVLGSICVEVSVWLVWSGIRVAGFSLQHAYTDIYIYIYIIFTKC